MTKNSVCVEEREGNESFPVRGIRMPLEMWEEIRERIEAEDTDFSKWARRALRRQLREAKEARQA